MLQKPSSLTLIFVTSVSWFSSDISDYSFEDCFGFYSSTSYLNVDAPQGFLLSFSFYHTSSSLVISFIPLANSAEIHIFQDWQLLNLDPYIPLVTFTDI